MKKIIRAVFFFVALLAAREPIAGATNDERMESWSSIPGAVARIGDEVVGAYADPRFNADIVLYPGCWLLRRADREILLTNCSFKRQDHGLLFDSGYRPAGGRLGGVLWGDPKMEISIYSRLFRRPKFTETEVKFWTGSRWVEVTGLPRSAQ